MGKKLEALSSVLRFLPSCIFSASLIDNDSGQDALLIDRNSPGKLY